MPVQGEFLVAARLVDGAEATLRILRPEDYDAVVSLAVYLSAEERYQRFFTVHPTYIGEWALSLTKPAEGIVALGAFESGELIGVANYAELSRPGECEIAVVVAHEQHERGVGTALVEDTRAYRKGGRAASLRRRCAFRKLCHATGTARRRLADHPAPRRVGAQRRSRHRCHRSLYALKK